MRDKVLFYLASRTPREKILLFIIAILLGAFLGVKAAQSVLGAFFDYDFTQLNAQKREFSESKALQNSVLTQENELKSLQNLLSHFQADEKDYLDALYAQANRANIEFSNVKNSTQAAQAFDKHTLSLEFECEFSSCLAFLNAIQHAPLFFEFKNLKLNKNEATKTLKVLLQLRFAAFKRK